MTKEYALLVETIRKITGFTVDDDKIYLIDTRLRELMGEYKLSTYDDVAHVLIDQRDPEFTDQVIERITTHETRFFRDESVYDALIMQMIPEWFEKQGITRMQLGFRKLEIWSAACSSGQEPYSIAMMLQERLPDVAKNVTILATDIARETVEKAEKGLYTKFEVERGVPKNFLEKYFTPVGENFQINESIRKMVQFKVMNLLSSDYPGLFDIIFCRNVGIYFDPDIRKDVYLKIQSSLKTDSILILGSAESLSPYLTDYVLREYGLTRYYELNAVKVTIFKQTPNKS